MELNEVFQSISENINWIVFFIVLAVGYGVRKIPVANQIRKTIRIVVMSLIISGIYAYFKGIEIGDFIASYFIAIGFHSAFLKLIEEKIQGKNVLFAQSDFIGSRPNDR